MWDSSDEDDGDDCFDDVADIIERELAESRRLPVDNVDDDADADVNDDGVNGLHQEMPREEMDDEVRLLRWTRILPY